MRSSTQPLPPSEPLLRAKARVGSAIVVSALLACAISSIAFGGAWVETKAGLWLNSETDNPSEAERRARESGFAAMAPVPLLLVSDTDKDFALQGMGLTQHEKDLLSAAFAPAAIRAQGQTIIATEAAGSSKAAAATPTPLPQSLPVVAPKSRMQLAWITLWDTDAEDGDVVRINSGGYERTVTLAKKPITFAVPVPSSGVIQVTGISDGDGGGVTVGIASGTAQAIFPIMSVGQTLGLHVRIN